MEKEPETKVDWYSEGQKVDEDMMPLDVDIAWILFICIGILCIMWVAIK